MLWPERFHLEPLSQEYRIPLTSLQVNVQVDQVLAKFNVI